MESKFYILSNLVILSTSSLAAEFFLAAELTTSFSFLAQWFVKHMCRSFCGPDCDKFNVSDE